MRAFINYLYTVHEMSWDVVAIQELSATFGSIFEGEKEGSGAHGADGHNGANAPFFETMIDGHLLIRTRTTVGARSAGILLHARHVARRVNTTITSRALRIDLMTGKEPLSIIAAHLGHGQAFSPSLENFLHLATQAPSCL